MSMWSDPHFVEGLLHSTLRSNEALTCETIRTTLYTSVSEVTLFRPSLAIAIYQKFAATKVLDFCAGWGDRLIAAIASGVTKYQGFDPNADLIPGHTAIIQRFAGEKASQYNISYVPFEDALVDSSDYDLVFTSPPYFNFEVYSNASTQSSVRYPSFNDWMVRFLFASLRKAWDALILSGHMVINISDVYATKICECMCLYIQGYLSHSVYVGVINSLGSERARPIWVFRKDKEASSGEISLAAQFELQRNYPEIAGML